MKAILVIDMPERCFNCPLHQTVDGEDNEFMVFCNAEHWREPITHKPIENLGKRPEWCPLKPMPMKKKIYQEAWNMTDVVNLTNIGWNACIDEILGEKE